MSHIVGLSESDVFPSLTLVVGRNTGTTNVQDPLRSLGQHLCVGLAQTEFQRDERLGHALLVGQLFGQLEGVGAGVGWAFQSLAARLESRHGQSNGVLEGSKGFVLYGVVGKLDLVNGFHRSRVAIALRQMFVEKYVLGLALKTPETQPHALVLRLDHTDQWQSLVEGQCKTVAVALVSALGFQRVELSEVACELSETHLEGASTLAGVDTSLCDDVQLWNESRLQQGGGTVQTLNVRHKLEGQVVFEELRHIT